VRFLNSGIERNRTAYGKSIDKEIAMGAQKWTSIPSTALQNCLDTLKVKATKSLLPPHENDCLMEDFDISKPSALFWNRKRRIIEEILNVPMVF
jgi:tRNA (guanosine-2'-O-)-methyltransferase